MNIEELKELQLTHSELKALDDQEQSGVIEGYASVFGSIDSSGDTILPTAYNKVLGTLPKMFFNHDTFGVPIGKWTEMSVDEKGLKVKGQLNLELEDARKVYSAVKFGSLNGLSVHLMFTDKDVDWDDESDVRIIKSVARLPEISIVGIPCEQKAQIIACKNFESINSVRNFEKALRDLGASQKESLTLVSQAKKLFATQRDSDEKQLNLNEISARLSRLTKIMETK